MSTLIDLTPYMAGVSIVLSVVALGLTLDTMRLQRKIRRMQQRKINLTVTAPTALDPQRLASEIRNQIKRGRGDA